MVIVKFSKESIFYSFFIIVLFLLFSPLLAFGAVSPPESDNKKEQIKQIETDLSREKAQYLKFKSKEKELLAQLSSVEIAIEKKRGILKELQAKLSENRKQLKSQQAQLAKQEKSLAKSEELMNRRLVAFYKHSKRGYIQILSSANDLGQLNNRIKYLKSVLEEDYQVLKQISVQLKRFSDDVNKTKERIGLITSLEKEESTKLLSIKKDLENKVILLARIHKEKEFYKTAVQELQLAADKLKQTVLNIEREQREDEQLPKGFAKKKGRLPLPYRGKVIRGDSKFGLDNLKTHNGVYITGSLGSDIKAIFPGRIDFSGQLKGYGQVMVINHGSRYFTISTHLSQIEKEEGEMVAAGEVIGLIGETGLAMGPGIYFEIRQGGKSLNPLKWLKVN